MKGFSMPLSGEDLLDSEFGNDTSLYLDGYLCNLQLAENKLNVLHKAFGA